MKIKTVFICQECGSRSAKWSGRCTSCGAWSSFVEETESRKLGLRKDVKPRSQKTALSEISTDNVFRLITGISEFDRVLGGGIVPGSFVLIGGDPGIGKSTLTLQLCGNMKQYKPLYVTGEESLEQIKLRSTRLKNIDPGIEVLAETNVETIDNVIQSGDNGVIIVDSIQAVYSSKLDATPGSIIQVRESASLLMNTAKQTNKPIMIIGHVTKEGVIAGPKILEHMVDTVLQFEGDKTYSYRILRAHKNRFGSTNEIGIFDMTEEGLQEVKNPSAIFLDSNSYRESGLAIIAAMEGSRPILHEIQALVTPTGYSVPQRTANGFDLRRLNLIIAVLEKRLGAKFRQNDVFANVTGGVYINDPASDLGIAAALMSSYKEVSIEPLTVLIGEIGLTGEIRPVSFIENRIAEAEKLGFKKVYLSSQNLKKISRKFKIDLHSVDRLSLAMNELFK